jgi:aminopeptidase
MDPRIKKLAQILVHHSARITTGDRVAIEATMAAEPLVRALYREILSAGGYPYPLLKIPQQDLELLTYGNEEQIGHVDQIRHQAYKEFESRIRIYSSTDPQELNGFSGDKQALFHHSKSPILKTQLDRGARGELKWVTTLFPTEAYAAQAGMDLEEYQDFVYSACLADQQDPVQSWHKVRENQEAGLNLFQGHDRVKLTGPNIDLELSIKGRKFINCYGVNNMPDGEIFTGPVETSLNGWVRYTYPAVYSGVMVKGVELEFKEGKVVRAAAEEQEEYLLKLLDSDPGARYAGEFAVGTNLQVQRFTGNILFDEKIGGTIHIALGSGYPETGSTNQSAIHWDMICDMRENSTIEVDGTPVYRDGEFIF